MKIPFLLLIAACASYATELSLVPVVRTFYEEGGAIKRLTFKGPNVDYHLTIDSELDLEKFPEGVRLTFKKIPSAVFEIRSSNADKNTPLTHENYPAFLASAKAHIPALAKDVQLIEEIPDPHPINSWKSYRCVFEYSLGKVKKRLAVTYITLAEGPQVLLLTSSNTGDFENSIARSDTLIRSWFTVRAGESPSQSN